MPKRRAHQVRTSHRAIKPWYLLIIAVVSTLMCVFALRANNEHMITLRNDVYSADKNDGDVQTALRSLQAYVTAHMNTNLSAGPNAVYPPIQLKYTYERLIKAQTDSTNANDVYTQAQQYCEGQNSRDFSGRNRVPCIEQYVNEHTATKANIPDALYKFSFVSPKWSPDLAGWSMLIAGAAWIGFIVFLIRNRVTRN